MGMIPGIHFLSLLSVVVEECEGNDDIGSMWWISKHMSLTLPETIMVVYWRQYSVLAAAFIKLNQHQVYGMDM